VQRVTWNCDFDEVFMNLMDWLGVVSFVVGLPLGYVGARGELLRMRRASCPSCSRRRRFWNVWMAANPQQVLYLLESLLMVAAIAATGVMFSAIVALPDAEKAALQAWLFGGLAYLFSLYRLSQYLNATARFDKTIAPVRAAAPQPQEWDR
jgi:hypothetical protein